jgi:predicted DNA-binding transcriptional regulator AlpA
MHTEATFETKKATQARKLAEQVQLFTFLPNCALVALPVVCAITGRSPASIWRDVRAGRLVKPVNAGPRCTRWRVGDLKAWAEGTWLPLLGATL